MRFVKIVGGPGRSLGGPGGGFGGPGVVLALVAVGGPPVLVLVKRPPPKNRRGLGPSGIPSPISKPQEQLSGRGSDCPHRPKPGGPEGKGGTQPPPTPTRLRRCALSGGAGSRGPGGRGGKESGATSSRRRRQRTSRGRRARRRESWGK